MDGSLDQPPIVVAQSVSKVRWSVGAAVMIVVVLLVPLLTLAIYSVAPRLSGMGAPGVIAVVCLLVTAVGSLTYRWAYYGRKAKTITLDERGVSLAQGDRTRHWPWAEVINPQLLPNSTGIIFGNPLDLTGDKRVFGDEYEMAPSELLALMRAAKRVWGSASGSVEVR